MPGTPGLTTERFLNSLRADGNLFMFYLLEGIGA